MNNIKVHITFGPTVSDLLRVRLIFSFRFFEMEVTVRSRTVRRWREVPAPRSPKQPQREPPPWILKRFARQTAASSRTDEIDNAHEDIKGETDDEDDNASAATGRSQSSIALRPVSKAAATRRKTRTPCWSRDSSSSTRPHKTTGSQMAKKAAPKVQSRKRPMLQVDEKAAPQADAPVLPHRKMPKKAIVMRGSVLEDTRRLQPPPPPPPVESTDDPAVGENGTDDDWPWTIEEIACLSYDEIVVHAFFELSLAECFLAHTHPSSGM